MARVSAMGVHLFAKGALTVNRLEEILAFNREFVANREYEPYRTSKFPNKKLVVLSCMDTRLNDLLPRAMNLKNGDAKIHQERGGGRVAPIWQYHAQHHCGGLRPPRRRDLRHRPPRVRHEQY